METATLNNSTSCISYNKLLNNSVFLYDLPELIKNMKNTSGWKNGELAATVLLNSPDKQIVLTLLHDDTEVNSFQSGDSLTLQMIEGKIKLITPAKTVILNYDQLLTLNDKTKFRLTSLEESVLLFTFSRTF